MKKILVLGSGGMAGHVVNKYLISLEKYEVFNSAVRLNVFDNTYILDVRESDKLKQYLNEINPDIVVNCIGILIEKASRNIEDAILVNSYLPNLLSRIGKELSFKLIHISTDCVFSGKRGNYTENSFCDGDTAYARSKTLGEINNARDLTIRTSIIGPELKKNGTGLLHWFLHQNGEINGFENVFWSGVTTLELAKAIENFIIQEISGLYNLSPDKKISKYDLLSLFKQVWNKDSVTIKPYADYQSDKSLCSNRKDFNFKVKDYKKMLHELKEWMENNRNIYQQYF